MERGMCFDSVEFNGGRTIMDTETKEKLTELQHQHDMSGRTQGLGGKSKRIDESVLHTSWFQQSDLRLKAN